MKLTSELEDLRAEVEIWRQRSTLQQELAAEFQSVIMGTGGFPSDKSRHAWNALYNALEPGHLVVNYGLQLHDLAEAVTKKQAKAVKKTEAAFLKAYKTGDAEKVKRKGEKYINALNNVGAHDFANTICQLVCDT